MCGNFRSYLYVQSDVGVKIFQLNSGLEVLAYIHNPNPHETGTWFDQERQAHCIFVPPSELEHLIYQQRVYRSAVLKQEALLGALDYKLKKCYGVSEQAFISHIDLYDEQLNLRKLVKLTPSDPK